jgi:hypothetical protein
MAKRGRVRKARWRFVPLLFACLLAMPLATAAQQTTPTPEQLLAATLHAGDLSGIGGGWWDDAPEFNDRLEPDANADMLGLVMAHVYGKPDESPAEVATGIHLYARAAAALDAFAASAATDLQDFDSTFDGPRVGEQSRYLRQTANADHEGGVALRFRYSRYLVRIEIGGDPSSLPPTRLAKLGTIVVERLSALDAGKLAAPAPPPLAQALPPADTMFTPVLGTAELSPQSWAWVWASRAGRLVISWHLTGILRDNVMNEAPVLRRYGLASSRSSVAEVTVMPFRTAGAAQAYLSEAKREDARRAGLTEQEGEIAVSPPIPDVAPAYRGDIRVGRYVAEVTCYAPFAPTPAACGDAVAALAERVKKSLPAR